MEVAQDLSPHQIDALREVANIGAGHAATALSQLTNLNVMISVPRVVFALGEPTSPLIADSRSHVTSVLMRMLGDATGHTLLMIRDDTAKLLCDLLLQRTPDSGANLDELEQSSLKETANILGGAYLSALSALTKMMLLPSAPHLITDKSATEVVALVTQAGAGREVLCQVETKFFFEEAGLSLKADFFLVLDQPAIKAILDAILPA